VDEMKFGAIKGLIGAVAPTIGQALGGPLGGTAAQAIASVLGCAPDERSIQKAVQNATPEQLAEIKKAELEFEARMKELDVDVFKLETQDIQDARSKFSDDWTARSIGLIMVCFFCGFITLITLEPPGNTSMELINLILGYLGGLVSAVVSFYFGASQKHGR
tara:strand:+ start:912 stop:1397 length:486 start_codon:yes stop_codon:yes gene_type:complete